MKCEYCNIRESKYITKNGKHCCEKNYQSCPSIREKNSKGLTKSLKEQYDSGKRVSHFKKINDGSFWKGRKQHSVNIEYRINFMKNYNKYKHLL
jgi:SPX domain protein involved in polyphosphate accumulation